MCIVELDGRLFGEFIPIGIAPSEASYKIGHRAGYEKVLLHKTQPLPTGSGVVGIENSGEGFGLERLGHCSDEVPVAERRKVEVFRCVRSPEAKRINRLAAVTDYRPIIGHTYYRGGFPGARSKPRPPHLKE